MTTRHIMTGLVLAAVIACPAVAWAEFVAKVITVYEGDRVSIRHDGRTEIIKLKGVECPKLKQPYGKKAKQVMEAYVGTREVMVRDVQRDAEGRKVADIFLMDGRNVAYEMIKEGLAWAREGGVEDRSFIDAEDLVRAAHKGLWADPDPVPPWKWQEPKKARRKFSD